MKARSCTIKKSTAPFFYTIIQTIMISVIAYHIHDLIDFSSIETIIFWLFLPLVFTTYFLTFCKDPGFIPFDFISVTESSYRNEIMKAKDLNLSCNASSINKSKDSTHIELLKTDPENKDVSMQKQQVKPENKIIPAKATHKSNENNDISFSDINKSNEVKMENPIVEKEKETTSPQKQGRNSFNVDELVCEPSFCENDSSEKHSNLKVKNSKELEVDSCFLKQLEENNIKEVSQEFPKEEAKIQEKKKEKENLLGNKTRSNDYEITKDNTMVSTTCATKNENLQNSKTKESSREKETKTSDKSINNEEEVEKARAINQVVASLALGFTKEKEKNMNIEDLENFYIEKRYCTICNIEQPIRSKHCKECNRCVALYDHHCPWMGTCIGEKNHLLFLVFLFFQLTEIVWAIKYIMVWCFKTNITTVLDMNIGILILTIVVALSIIGFFFMVFLLICAHLYLTTKNLTTWENLSWKKISYLREWPKNKGSPFTLGIRENIRKFMQMNLSSLITNWKIPKKNLKLPPV